MDKNKVYISPSLQEHNIGVGNYGTEEYRTNIIADYLCAILRENGFDVRESHPTMTLAEVVADSNKWGAGIHGAIHTNAGGGKGTEVWHYDGAVAGGNLLAQAIYKHLAPVTPAPDRGVKANKTFFETRETRAAAALIEVAFHDDPEDARFIANHPLQIAVAIAKGICEFADREFKNPFASMGNETALETEYAKLKARYDAKVAECNEKDADIKRAAGILNKHLA